MKKTLAILVALMMVMAVFAGCSSAPKATEAPVVSEEAPVVSEEAPVVSEEAPVVSEEAPVVGSDITGAWVADIDSSYTMNFDSTTNTVVMGSDGSSVPYTFDGTTVTLAVAEGDLVGTYDPANDTITFTANGTTVVYSRVAA